MLNREKDATPLYIQIKKIVQEEINANKYPAGGIIPSEVELQQMYQVSRNTIRQAMQELEFEGIVRKQRGIGTIVLEQPMSTENQYSTNVKSFAYEMLESSMDTTTFESNIEIVTAQRRVAKALNINEGDEVYHLSRVRGTKDKKVVFFETYLIKDMNLVLDNSQYYGSLYEMLKQKGVEIGNVYEAISAKEPNDLVREKLEMDEEMPILVRERVVSDKNGRLFEYTTGFYHSKKYKYNIEFIVGTK